MGLTPYTSKNKILAAHPGEGRGHTIVARSLFGSFTRAPQQTHNNKNSLNGCPLFRSKHTDKGIACTINSHFNLLSTVSFQPEPRCNHIRWINFMHPSSSLVRVRFLRSACVLGNLPRQPRIVSITARALPQ